MATYALITGASSGLGEQFARLFAKDKISVVLVARREDRLKKIKSELEAAHRIKVEIVPLDLIQRDFSKRLMTYLETKNIEVEYLVNNAGYGKSGAFSDITLDHNLGQIDLNIRSLTELTYKLLPMLKKHRGKILNIGSTAGYQPGPYMTVYYASKAFVNSFSEALYYELKNSGVTVTLSCPGPTFTEFAKVSNLEHKRLFQVTAMTAEIVAEQAYRAMQKGTRTVIHGAKNKFSTQAIRFAPKGAILKVVAMLNSSK